MNLTEFIALASALTVLVGGFVTAKTSVRKSELEGFQQQLQSLHVDLDRKDKEIKRLSAEAKQERRARRAIERALRNKQNQINELTAIVEVLIRQLDTVNQQPEADLSVLNRIRELNDTHSAEVESDDESDDDLNEEE